jgi:hypothetical protein
LTPVTWRLLSPDLEDLLPKLLVFWKFLDVVDGEHVGRGGADFLKVATQKSLFIWAG